jgi:hypothetical protein
VKQFRAQNGGGGGERWLDDIVFDDSAEPEELGIQAIHPNADGDTIQLNRAPTSSQRFYFPYPDELPPTQETSNDIVPIGSELMVDPDASWEQRSTLSFGKLIGRRPEESTKETGELTGVNQGFSSNDDQLLGQWVSDPIAEQTISGTVTGRFRAREVSSSLNARAQIVIRVVSGDGQTVRGTLLASDTAALSSEFTTSGTGENRKFPRTDDTALTSVDAEAGDRIVVEVGYRADSVASFGHIMTGFEPDVIDLPEDETATTGNPWLEFSAAITMHATNFPAVDDSPNPDEDGSYVAETTQDDRDLYQFEDIGAEWSNVYGVTMWVRARETEPGATKMAHGVKNGGTTSDGSDVGITPDYEWYPRHMATDPTDASAWTRAKVNSLQAGPKVR